MLEGTPVSLPVNADSDFQPTADALASAWGRNTRGLLVASPANPTGAVIPQLRLAELSAAIADRGGNLVVDEIYHGLTYGFEADTALALDNEVFVINSFSKYFGMTGWRLGWLVAPERHVREISPDFGLGRIDTMRNLFLAIPIVVIAIGGSTACATKKFVRTSVGEVNDKVDSLGRSLEETQERTRQNEAKIGDVDTRAQAAAGQAKQAADAANSAAGQASTPGMMAPPR